MLFTRVQHNREIPANAAGQAFLIENNWDDWDKFRTEFQLVVFNHKGKRFDPGLLKIGEFGLQPAKKNDIRPGFRAPKLERVFDTLDEGHFSLGQDETYYETLNELLDDLREAVLKGLRDCAQSLQLFDKAANESVMQESLLRSVSADNVRNRFHRLAMGDARLTEFQFEYVFPETGQAVQPQPVLAFHVSPHSVPPTNVHVLIGRNGVGKTWCLQHMAKALLFNADKQDPQDLHGEIRPVGDNHKDWAFAGLVLISFSAFDEFNLPDAERTVIRSTMVSLRYKDKTGNSAVKTLEELTRDFSDSFQLCRRGLKAGRWRFAVQTLESDPLFAEADITSLLELSDKKWKSETERLFMRLSSGHKIVLLTITRLVELVDERTLVLLEEPEVHLHPPLLSAFIRCLAELLTKRNGVAIVATHSPVVLQEVPKSCVWMLRRVGGISTAERPTMETFGENVGILTGEVFGLEVTKAGFHQMVRKAVDTEKNYEQVLSRFGGQLGAEARAITMALIADRNGR